MGSEMCIRDSIWAPGPYGPRVPGPRALPCWANTSPKNAPWKKESKLCFLCIFGKQKRCAASVRSFSTKFRAEISAKLMCQKTKVSLFEKRPNFVRNLVRKLPSEFASKKWSRKCPSNPTSTCAGGQDDVSSKVNSLKLVKVLKYHPRSLVTSFI